MPRDHMMGFIQPTEGADVHWQNWWCANEFPLGVPKNRAIVGLNAGHPADIRACQEEDKARDFERGDHTPMYMREYPPMVVNPIKPPLVYGTDFWSLGFTLPDLTPADTQKLVDDINTQYTAMLREAEHTINQPLVLTEADAIADLNGTPRPVRRVLSAAPWKHVRW